MDVGRSLVAPVDWTQGVSTSRFLKGPEEALTLGRSGELSKGIMGSSFRARLLQIQPYRAIQMIGLDTLGP